VTRDAFSGFYFFVISSFIVYFLHCCFLYFFPAAQWAQQKYLRAATQLLIPSLKRKVCIKDAKLFNF